jgi:hypothetical protein
MPWIGQVGYIGRGAMLPLLVAGTVLGAVSGAGPPRVARADGGWLDDQAVTWNAAGMAIPGPVQMQSNVDPRCGRQARPAESDEDRTVEAAGWTLFANYTAGWGIKIISGLAGYDGMCRPIQYQGFVFVDGALAGTLSPTPMDSRTDGALNRTAFFGPESITATYVRYTDKDPLCCPSANSTAMYKIERTPAGPVLVRESTSTRPTNPTGP